MGQLRYIVNKKSAPIGADFLISVQDFIYVSWEYYPELARHRPMSV